MKKVILVITYFVFGEINSQSLSFQKVYDVYNSIDSMTFHFKYKSRNLATNQIGEGTSIYHINRKKESSKLHFTNYDIYNLDTALNYLALFQSKDSTVWKYDLKTSSFAKSDKYMYDEYASVHYFWTIEFLFLKKNFYNKRKIKFDFDRDCYYLKDRYSFYGYEREIFINKNSFLIDSFYYYHKDIDGNRIQEIFLFDYILPKSTLYHLNPKSEAVRFFLQRAENKLPIVVDTTKIVHLSAKYRLLDFWYIGCVPCRAVFPVLEELRREYPDSVLEIISLNYLDDSAAIEKFRTNKNYSFNMIKDAGNLYKYYDIQAFPTLLLFDSKGKIIFRHEGHDDMLLNQIRSLIK